MTGKRPWWRQLHGKSEVAGCRQVGRLLQSYLDGHIDDLTVRRVARHLDECRRCGLEATTYAEIKAALARRSRPVPTDVITRLRAFGDQLVAEAPAEDEIADC